MRISWLGRLNDTSSPGEAILSTSSVSADDGDAKFLENSLAVAE
jgi:hypothetical protein